jgi:hypothetical protein
MLPYGYSDSREPNNYAKMVSILSSGSNAANYTLQMKLADKAVKEVASARGTQYVYGSAGVVGKRRLKQTF